MSTGVNSTVTPPRSIIQPIVRGVYDLQKLRIQAGNRIAGNFRAKLGQKPGEKEEELDDEAKEILTEVKQSFRRMTDGMVKRRETLKPEQFKGDNIISNYAEYTLVAHYLMLETQERQSFARFEEVLQEFPIYTQYLTKIQGIGPAMAGVIISEFDIHRAVYVSKLWAAAGYDVVVVDGKGAGRSRRKEHLVKRDYINKEGKPDVRDSITFNPWLKTKMRVLATCLIRSNNTQYRKVYDDYKHRIENMDVHKSKTPAHRNNMAIRYMIKIFLQDLYNAWRPLEGLEVFPTYQEAKLGHKHGQAGQSAPVAVPVAAAVEDGAMVACKTCGSEKPADGKCPECGQ